MALGFVDIEGQVQGVMVTLRCGNPDCNHPVAQAHLMGMGIFRVLDCPNCRRATEFENTHRGWTVKLLPKRAAVVPQPRAQR